MGVVQEIAKAWKMVDGALEKEKRARETIHRLKSEIQNLSRLVDQGAGLSLGQENQLNELLKQREELQKTVEQHQQTIKTHVQQIADLTAKSLSSSAPPPLLPPLSFSVLNCGVWCAEPKRLKRIW